MELDLITTRRAMAMLQRLALPIQGRRSSTPGSPLQAAQTRLARRGPFEWPAVAAELALAVFLFGCGSSIDSSLDDKTCNRHGECLPGYVCTPEYICVKQPSTVVDPQTEADASTPVDAGKTREPDGVQTGTGTPPAVTCSRGVACDDVCVDTDSTAEHCGACGNQCAGTQDGHATCIRGTCGVACEDGFTRCGDRCYQLSNDTQHCGSCTFSCPASTGNSTTACVQGKCQTTCNPGYQDCAGVCVQLATDPSHCGACGTMCAADQICSGGVCVKECPAGTVECERGCVDLKSDARHCGACGRACAAPETATALCQDGVCGADCGPGRTACNGACVDTQIDTMHCGACGRACPDGPGFSHPVCEAGSCNTRCDLGFVACEGQCVSLALLANSRAFAACAVLAGLEDISMCAGMGENQAFCGNQCVHTATDERHCGGCWRTCDEGQVCELGACK